MSEHKSNQRSVAQLQPEAEGAQSEGQSLAPPAFNLTASNADGGDALGANTGGNHRREMRRLFRAGDTSALIDYIDLNRVEISESHRAMRWIDRRLSGDLEWLVDIVLEFGKDMSGWPPLAKIQYHTRNFAGSRGPDGVMEVLREANGNLGDTTQTGEVIAVIRGIWPVGSNEEWLAIQIVHHGATTSSWPAMSQLEFEMKGMPGSRGINGVLEVLRTLNGSEAQGANAAQIQAFIAQSFEPESESYWWATQLFQYGERSNWPLLDQLKFEMSNLNGARGLSGVREVIKANPSKGEEVAATILPYLREIYGEGAAEAPILAAYVVGGYPSMGQYIYDNQVAMTGNERLLVLLTEMGYWTALRDLIVATAEAEYETWTNEDGSRKQERDRDMSETLQDYWATGTGLNYSIADMRSRDFQSGHPWSAAFISWVLKTSGAGDQFRYSANHMGYVYQGKLNREGASENPFYTYDIDEVAPQVGDIIANNRGGGNFTYDNIDSHQGQSHTDIVVSIDRGNNTLEAIGGNTRDTDTGSVNTVGRKTVNLTEAGMIDTTEHPLYFAILRIRDRPSPEQQAGEAGPR